MKSLPYLTLVFTLATAPMLVQAADPAPASAEVAKVPHVAPFRGTVSAVDTSANTFTIANKDNTKIRIYNVAKAKLTKDEKDITLAEVKVGDYARGSGLKIADGKVDVNSVKFGPKTAEELAADKAKKEAKEADKAAAQ